MEWEFSYPSLTLVSYNSKKVLEIIKHIKLYVEQQKFYREKYLLSKNQADLLLYFQRKGDDAYSMLFPPDYHVSPIIEGEAD